MGWNRRRIRSLTRSCSVATSSVAKVLVNTIRVLLVHAELQRDLPQADRWRHPAENGDGAEALHRCEDIAAVAVTTPADLQLMLVRSQFELG